MPLLLDLFCGRFGWSKAFLDRGWGVVGIDLKKPEDIPVRAIFFQLDILECTARRGVVCLPNGCAVEPDYICASSPCEEFSVRGMKHFHPHPKYPDLGMKLFNHTRSLCEVAGIPYVMENVRAAEKFVGNAVRHCGPFYLWGTAVPPLMPQGIKKGLDLGSWKMMKGMAKEERREYRAKFSYTRWSSSSKQRREYTAKAATIPRELSTCVADYAEALMIV
jgi:hypothetical protein